MQKFMDWMERNLVPIAAKIGSQKHMVAMRDGFASIMPLMVVGAFGALIHGFPNKYVKEELLAGDKPLHFLDTIALNIYGGTLYTMSVFATVAIAYALAKAYDSDGLASGLLSLACMLTFTGMFNFKAPVTWAGMDYSWMGWQPAMYSRWFGGEGLLIAVATALIATTLFVKLEQSGKLNISLPEGVPPAVARAFSALLPSAVVLTVAGIIVCVCDINGIKDIYWSVYISVAQPLMGLAATLPAVLLVVFLQQILWFFGLHGSNILAPVISGIFLPLTAENAAAVAGGKAAPHIVSSQFLDSYVNSGGSGLTIALLLAIAITGKSQLGKSVSAVSIGPALFNINEPVIFGLPIVLNPIYIIPFTIAPMVAAIIAYFATSSGFVDPCNIVVAWTTPPILSAFLSTGQWQGAVVATLGLVAGFFIYLPFVIFGDKKELELERQAEAGSSVNM